MRKIIQERKQNKGGRMTKVFLWNDGNYRTLPEDPHLKGHANNLPCMVCEFKIKWEGFILNQKDIPQEYIDIVNKNFWDLV